MLLLESVGALTYAYKLSSTVADWWVVRGLKC
jgi:hypothetical protein